MGTEVAFNNATGLYVRIDSQTQVVRKTATFTGAAGLGAAGDFDLFTVTGEIYVVRITAFCSTLLVENAGTVTMSLGTTTDVDQFIASTEPEDIDANEFWTAIASGVAGPVVPPTIMTDTLIAGATDDILLTIVTENINSGVLEFALQWEPISTDATVVAA